MRTRTRFVGVTICLLSAVVTSFLVAGPVSAKEAEPTITSLAWYWEQAQTQEQTLPDGSKVTVETPNPFCPSPGSGLGAPSQVCAEGRLPIEIQSGDYETPNKISAVGFDMTLVPVGSDVRKFTVTLREAATGCYEKDGKPDQDPNDDYCEETDPRNLGDHKLQACKVQSFFGDGEARQYKEAPKYKCSKSDPIGKRQRLPDLKDGAGSEFYWTFDLTSFAQEWAKSLSATTGIVITGVEPKGDGGSADWRVVLTGPKFENGATTSIVFDPAELPPIAPPGGTTVPTGSTTTGTGSTGFGTTGTGTGDFGSTGAGGTDVGEAAPASTPGSDAVALPQSEPTSAQGMPGYVWLAILAGLIGFTMVRSVVLDSTKGIRPDGVLATIHRINGERKDAAAAAAETGNPIVAGLKDVGRNVRSVAGKLAFWKKG